MTIKQWPTRPAAPCIRWIACAYCGTTQEVFTTLTAEELETMKWTCSDDCHDQIYPPISPLWILQKLIPGLTAKVRCPQPSCYSPPEGEKLSGLIVHMNDAHEWTREAIADWLESLDVDLSFPVGAS